METDADAWLQDRRHVLNDRLSEIEHKLKRGHLDGVRLEKGRLRITPHEADTPPEAIRLERAMDAIMPRIRITDLLWEAIHIQDSWTPSPTCDQAAITKTLPCYLLPFWPGRAILVWNGWPMHPSMSAIPN